MTPAGKTLKRGTDYTVAFDHVVFRGAPEAVLRNEEELREYMLQLTAGVDCSFGLVD